MTAAHPSGENVTRKLDRVDSNLVYDVGVNNGDDTAYYLRRGHRVVAIEADPAMIAHCQQRFASEIAAGRLQLLNLAIADQEGEVTFYVSLGNRGVWSSLDPVEAARGGVAVRAVQVPGVRFASVLAEYGVPHYLKVDIEGRDHLCLRDLTLETRPPYLSFEANEGSVADLFWLAQLGYARFKLINQMRGFEAAEPPKLHSLALARETVRRAVGRCARRLPILKQLLQGMAAVRRTASGDVGRAAQFPVSSSGPMGPETAGRWMTLEEVTYAWLYFVRRTTESDWFDVHAALPE